VRAGIEQGMGWLFVLALLALPATASAQPEATVSAATSDGGNLGVTWSPTTTRRGTPAIEGYVANESGSWYRRVRIGVEALDADGRKTGETTVYVDQPVPPGSRVYFVGGVPPGQRHRVSVLSFERFGRGAGP